MSCLLYRLRQCGYFPYSLFKCLYTVSDQKLDDFGRPACMGMATIDKHSWQHLILTVSDQLLELQGLFQQLHACMSVMMW